MPLVQMISEAYYFDDWGGKEQALKAKLERESKLVRMGYKIDWENHSDCFVLWAWVDFPEPKPVRP